ncbi:hypothetical protein D3C80_1628610 [compost metagenome]
MQDFVCPVTEVYHTLTVPEKHILEPYRIWCAFQEIFLQVGWHMVQSSLLHSFKKTINHAFSFRHTGGCNDFFAALWEQMCQLHYR